VGAGIIGGIIGGLVTFIAALFLWHPRTQGQRFALLGFIITVATLAPMIGSLIDAENQRQAGILSEKDAKAREQAAREEMRKEFRSTRDEMTASVRQIILALHELPPGQRRTRAIQSALLDYDRAASRMGPEKRTGVASLLPLAIESAAPPAAAAPAARVAEREQPQSGQRKPVIPDATTAASTVPAIASGAQVNPVVVTPVFIPPPPVVVLPLPTVIAPH
jgi:hypothetical protein